MRLAQRIIKVAWMQFGRAFVGNGFGSRYWIPSLGSRAKAARRLTTADKADRQK